MQENKIVYDKVMELFVSKAKTPEPSVSTYWTKRLIEKFPIKRIAKAIEDLIWNDDDWPTLGKISEQIREGIDLEFSNLNYEQLEDLWQEYEGDSIRFLDMDEQEYNKKKRELRNYYKVRELIKREGNAIENKTQRD